MLRWGLYPRVPCVSTAADFTTGFFTLVMAAYLASLVGTTDAPGAPADDAVGAAGAAGRSAGEFPPMKNDLILRAAKGEKVDKVPVWIMRQAGRYLPEFREMRKKYSFFELVETPKLACEISMQPTNRFPLDACIIFSDILVIPQAMGMKIEMKAGEGPVFDDPLKNAADLGRLKHVNAAVDLKYVMDAVHLTRLTLEGQVPLFGFSGAPWTLMAFMIEGKSSKTQSQAKKWLYTEPKGSKELLDKLELTIIDYMVELAKAGAQMLQLFDTNVGCLTEKTFLEYVKPGYGRIAKGIRDKLGDKCPPLFLFPKDIHFSLAHLRDCGYDVVSIDWCVDPAKARELLGPNITIQGNLDPCALYADEEQLKKLTVEMVKKFGKDRYIANLGHGMYPDMDPAKVAVFIDAVHSV